MVSMVLTSQSYIRYYYSCNSVTLWHNIMVIVWGIYQHHASVLSMQRLAPHRWLSLPLLLLIIIGEDTLLTFIHVYPPLTDWKYDVILKKEVDPSRPGLHSTMNFFRSIAALINKRRWAIIMKLVMRNWIYYVLTLRFCHPWKHYWA